MNEVKKLEKSDIEKVKTKLEKKEGEQVEIFRIEIPSKPYVKGTIIATQTAFGQTRILVKNERGIDQGIVLSPYISKIFVGGEVIYKK